jgi:hypothetical protein
VSLLQLLSGDSDEPLVDIHVLRHLTILPLMGGDKDPPT